MRGARPGLTPDAAFWLAVSWWAVERNFGACNSIRLSRSQVSPGITSITHPPWTLYGLIWGLISRRWAGVCIVEAPHWWTDTKSLGVSHRRTARCRHFHLLGCRYIRELIKNWCTKEAGQCTEGDLWCSASICSPLLKQHMLYNSKKQSRVDSS